ncbi:phosphoribosylformylglycinamidine synthase subunit PurQ [Nakamurella lactea]|uniref:phosphoribosylformylglycinamidine synthase subunit PurQ n=1 Tax=Nakamurella lactea TaxID=459515 RepID=UPI0003F8D550|nr:phosphoribosylformylglycinamidine synthase subunit PurQ [Nakamurella lactea]
MTARIGVITFPGTLDDGDAARAARYAGAEAVPLWHADADLRGVDGVLVPGGFSYGDYLRAGAIAAQAPVMRSVIDAAAGGLPVLGICNGFQVLCEAGLLPGALTRNAGLKFLCRDQRLRIENAGTVWTSGYADGAEILIPMKNAEGRFVATEDELDRIEGDGLVVMRYVGDGHGQGNPNGSMRDIAAIGNPAGNVVGLMPHPEHAIDALTGPGTDGLAMFTAVVQAISGPVGASV